MGGRFWRIGAGSYRVRIVAVVVALVAAHGAAAAAQAEGPNPEKKAAARELLVEGDRLLKRGEFEQALGAFRRAYELYPSPKIHYNFGLANQGLGRLADALDAFDTFLKDAPDAPTEVRDKARVTRDALLARVGFVRVTADVAGAAVMVDGRELGKTPLPGALRLDPGPHLLLVDRSDGGPKFTQRLEVVAGATIGVAVHLTPSTPEATSPARPLPSASDSGTAPSPLATTPTDGAPVSPATNLGRPWRIAGIAVASAGVACLGAGLLFGLAARDASADVSNQFDASRDSGGKTYETLQWVGYGVGTAALATAAVLFIRGVRLDAQPEAPPLQAVLLPGRIVLEGRF